MQNDPMTIRIRPRKSARSAPPGPEPRSRQQWQDEPEYSDHPPFPISDSTTRLSTPYAGSFTILGEASRFWLEATKTQ